MTFETGPPVGREGWVVVALDVELDRFEASVREMREPDRGRVPAKAAALVGRGDPDDVHLADSRGGILDLRPVEGGQLPLRVLDEEEAGGVEPRLLRPTGEAGGVEASLLGVVDEGGRVEREQRGLVLAGDEGPQAVSLGGLRAEVCLLYTSDAADE